MDRVENPFKNGPYAFPFMHGESGWACSGMTLRDWYAGQWLAGMMAGGQKFESPEMVAEEAFAVADAMLAARVREVPHD